MRGVASDMIDSLSSLSVLWGSRGYGLGLISCCCSCLFEVAVFLPSGDVGRIEWREAL